MKIGALVQNSFPKLVEKGLLTQEDIMNLQDLKYSKNTFDINYPFLKKVTSNLPLIEERMVNNYSRYYAKPVTINNERYIITNDWYDRSKTRYIQWLALKGYDI